MAIVCNPELHPVATRGFGSLERRQKARHMLAGRGRPQRRQLASAVSKLGLPAGLDGTCDGAGSCRYPARGTACGSHPSGFNPHFQSHLTALGNLRRWHAAESCSRSSLICADGTSCKSMRASNADLPDRQSAPLTGNCGARRALEMAPLFHRNLVRGPASVRTMSAAMSLVHRRASSARAATERNLHVHERDGAQPRHRLYGRGRLLWLLRHLPIPRAQERHRPLRGFP